MNKIFIFAILAICYIPSYGSTKNIIFIRHGDTGWNYTMIYNTTSDLHLNALGKTQARKLSRVIQNNKDYQIISSTLNRAKDTIHIMLRGDILLRVKYDSRLNERYYGNFNVSSPLQKESVEQFESRVNSFLTEYLNNGPKNLMLVSHGGVFKIFTKNLLGKEYNIQKGQAISIKYNDKTKNWEYVGK